jgi:glycosyltransferase involved in cell wall biosynthesis
MPTAPDEPLVQVVGPEDGWVLERLARVLAAKLPYGEFVPWKPRPGGAAQVAYYVNYALYDGPSGLLDVGFFTHDDEAHGFLDRARRVDFCVCMSRLYADSLRARGVPKVAHVPMGFDSYRYRPRLVLGVVGRLDHPRKGQALVERLRHLPFVEIVTTDGRLPEQDLRDFYQRLDYVLVPATVEGGPLSLLEGLGMGKPVIAPEGVGMVPEFPETDAIRRYPAGDAEALAAVVMGCYEEKWQHARLVRDRSWDAWAQGHHHLFVQLLRAHGRPVLVPALGFRFGMVGELDVPPGIDAAPLEAAVDRAARHLLYGRSGPARCVLEEVLPRFPCLRSLLATIPRR